MKKLIVLFFIFSILALSANLAAKERQGAEIKIYKTELKMEGLSRDKPQIGGELIAVKKNSLLLMDFEGADVSVDIKDIEFIKIGKKSKAIFGFLLGGIIGKVIGKANYNPPKSEGSEPLVT